MDDGPYAEVQIATHPRIALEIARTPQEREAGLMFREALGQDSGMLFVFDTPTTVGFWMENTPLPLSIAFLDQGGTIVDIQDMQPFDAQTIHYPAAPYTDAVEVNQGWFLAHGVGVGQVMQLCLGR